MDVQCQVEPHAHPSVVQIVASDFPDTIESIKDGVAMHPKPLRRFFGAAVGGEEGIERADKAGIVLPVIDEQFA